MATPYAWVSHAPEVTSGADVAVHSAEMNALRHAVERGWKVTKVPYGSTLHEAIAAAAGEPSMLEQNKAEVERLQRDTAPVTARKPAPKKAAT